MIILNGSTQMSGMISRFMVMDRSLYDCTQLSHIRMAKKRDYGVVFTNGNVDG